MVETNNYNFKGITSFFAYDNGELEECRLNAYNIIHTKYGKLVPQYMNPGIRRKDSRALAFYRSGQVKSISLDEQTEILTPIGTFPAELVTFYEDGSINSLFPLNGQLSFSWSEEEEGNLAQKYNFSFPFGSFAAKISGLRFYENGDVRSLILWPEEIIEIDSPVGRIPIRIGFKLFDNGMIESLEPAAPITVATPIGPVKAYDTSALAMDADVNSMKFDRKGNLISLVTSGDIIIVHKLTGDKKIISSELKLGLMDDDFVKIPISINFFQNTVRFDNGKSVTLWNTMDYTFRFEYDVMMGKTPCHGECSMCSECS